MRSAPLSLHAHIHQLTQRVATLEAALTATQQACQGYKARFEESRQAYDVLLQGFKQLQRRQFGARSERFIDTSPAQGDFFSSVDAESLSEAAQREADDGKEEETSAETASTGKGNQGQQCRRTRGRGFAKHLPRREVIIPVEKPEGMGFTTWRMMRYETSELLHYVPPVYEVIVQKREVVVCEVEGTAISQLRIAENPKRVLPKAKVTEAFLAHLIVSKLYDRQPLYHLEKRYKEQFAFTCPRTTLARWFIDSAKALEGLVTLLHEVAMDYDVAFCDPTHLQVLDEPGRAATTKSYVYTLKGGPPDKPVVVYRYNPEHHKAFLEDWLSEFRGYLHVDGQNIFDTFKTKDAVTLVYCNSHARRKFEPIAKASRHPGLATEAMRYYQQLYAIEREAKEAGLTPAARYTLRQAKTVPLVAEFEQWLQAKAPLALPQSPLGKAMAYVSERLTGLKRFLVDGRLEVDTNSLEQKNKDFALPRKGFLFAQSVEGAKALCTHLSLIVTALENGLDPYQYYVHILEQIPHCHTVEAIEMLLPWRVQLPVKETEAARKGAVGSG